MRWWFRAANSLAAHLRGNPWRFNVRTIWRDVEAIEVHRLVLHNPYAMCRRAACKALDDDGTSHRNRVRRAAEHWENSYRCALEDGSRIDRMMVLRFEDLLEDPADRLERPCRFLALDYRAQMLPSPGQTRPLGSSRDGKWYPLRPPANEPYLDALSVSEVEIVEARCGTLAERFEYTPDGP